MNKKAKVVVWVNNITSHHLEQQSRQGNQSRQGFLFFYVLTFFFFLFSIGGNALSNGAHAVLQVGST
jgi:hypothetical protein